MAAVVMISVFSLFATGSIVELKEMGVGLAAAVLIDATLVRLVMLPAVLVLAPRTVEKMARRSPHGVSGHVAEDVVKAARQPELLDQL
jgi:RND superfamily putative drug exporter